jgi:hypothetical protein
MGLILLILVIFLLFSGGGYYGYRSGYYGGAHCGGGLGLIVLILILFLLFGGFHTYYQGVYSNSAIIFSTDSSLITGNRPATNSASNHLTSTARSCSSWFTS